MSNPTNSSTSTPSRKVVMNTIQKAEAITLWQAGAATLDELAKKFKVNRRTLQRLFDKEGVKKGEKAAEAAKAAAEAVKNQLSEDAAEYAKRVKATKDEQYAFAAYIAKAAYIKVAATEKAGKALSTISGDLKTMHLASQIFKNSLEQRFAVLGINGDDMNNDIPLPDLIVQELTVEEIKEMAKANMVRDGEEDDLFGVTMGDEELIGIEDNDDKVIEGD